MNNIIMSLVPASYLPCVEAELVTDVMPFPVRGRGEVVVIQEIKSIQSKWLVALLVMLAGIFLGFYGADLVSFKKAMDPAAQHQVVISQGEVAGSIEPFYSTAKTGVLSWQKPEGYAGGNAALRNFQGNVTMEENDEDIMSFTLEYTFAGKTQTAFCHWDKSEKFGEWEQDNPKSNGLWYVKPYQGDANLLKGELSDEAGNFVPVTLKLN